MFRNLGISHLLAVSGLHVGLIVLILYQLLLTLSLTRVPRTMLIIAFLIFYCYMTGGSPSVIRSSLMTAMLLMAPVFQRKYQALNAVAATALILLLVNPFYLRDVGFQFSFAAVFGILIGYRILNEKISYRPGNPVARYAWDMLMVSVSAALFTAPVALLYFNTLQIASLFLNIIAIPLTFCVMICAIVSLPGLFLPSFIADLVFHALDLSLELLRGMLRLASRSGIWTLTVSSYWKPCIMGVLVIMVIMVCVHHKKMKSVLCLISALLCLCWFFLSTRPEIVQLSLPRGTSILFRNGREALIVNTGSVRFNTNDYHANIQPVCTHWGIRRVTLVATSIEKSKTGTISHIRRDFPDCSLLVPVKVEEIEERQTVITADTGWTMGKYHIDLYPEEGEHLSVLIRTRKDSVYIGKAEKKVSCIMDPDNEVPKARHGILLANQWYWK
ncbi:MAG: ComEC/Rec2 family competence protein, partial [FCB group bacterium]|nr:ComEC/Rec2 family competence protein [FCB group bacterium]